MTDDPPDDEIPPDDREPDDAADGPSAVTGPGDEPTVPTESAAADAPESAAADTPSTEREQAADTPAESEEGASAAPDAGSRSRVESALTEVRRECWKAAVVHAVTEAAVVFFAVNLVLVTLAPPWLPERIPLPEAVSDPLVDLLGGSGSLAIPGSAGLAVAFGAVALLVGVGVRVRRPLVEQFEAANPALRESLRTARDAVRTDRRSRMARRLYESVLDDLKRSSSVGLLDVRRIVVTVVLITAVSVATIHLAVADITLAGLGEGPTAETPDGGTQSDYTGLQDGSSILGEPEDVPTGEESLDATVDTSGSGSGQGADAESAAAYEDSGFSGADSVESQRAGFTERERLEDAELIREYNLRIREESDS